MFWMMGPAIAAVAAAAAQAKAQRDSMQAYREAGIDNMKSLLGSKCEYCHGSHRSNYCPNCGAPTQAQQQRNDGGYPERQITSQTRMPISVMYGVQSSRPSIEVKLENSMSNQSTDAERKKRREEEEAAARRRRSDTSYTPPAAPDYSGSDSPSSGSSDSSSYSGGGGGFDGGGASGDY